MARLRTIFAESLRSLGANMSTTLAAAVTVLIGMFLLGLFVGLWSWAHSYDKQLKNQLAVRVYFCTASTCAQDATKAQENAIAARLSDDSRIKRVQYVSKEDALRQMRVREPKAVEVLPANPFPDALKIYPKSGDLTPVIGKELQDAGLGGVQNIDWGGKLTKHVLHVTHVIETFFIAAAILLILASTLLIAWYCRFFLGGGVRTFMIGAGLAGVYLFLYITLRQQDYALLMGAIALFIVLVIVMYVTRKVDWYARDAT